VSQQQQISRSSGSSSLFAATSAAHRLPSSATRVLSTAQVVTSPSIANHSDNDDEELVELDHPRADEIATFLSSMPENVTVDKPDNFLESPARFKYATRLPKWKTKTVDVLNFLDMSGPPVETIELSRTVFGEVVR
jgi:hypothetical protein